MKSLFVDEYGVTVLGGILATFSGIVLLLGLIMVGMYWGETIKCGNMRMLGFPQTYVSITTGCLVQHKGEWMTADTAMTRHHQVTVK